MTDMCDKDEPKPVTCCVSVFDKHIDGYNVAPENRTWIHKCCQNRWARAVCCCLTALLCATPYNNWSAFLQLLYKGGVYSWHCPAESVASNVICDSQRERMQPLFYVASGFEYSFGVVAGLIYDFMGPRSCGLIGLIILLLALIVLLISSKALDLYILAIILMGSSTNVIAFPGFILGNLFPSHKDAALTVFIACQLGSSIVPIIMLQAWNLFSSGSAFRSTLISYIFLAVVPCVMAYFFFLPCRRLPDLPDSAKGGNEEIASISSAKTAVPDTDSGPSMTSPTPTSSAGEKNVKTSSVECFTSSLPERPHSIHCTTPTDTGPSTTADVEEPVMAVQKAHDDGEKAPKASWWQLRREICTWEVHIFTIYYILQVVQYVYFQNSIEHLYRGRILTLAGYIALLQIVFGISVAFIVNYVGTLVLCYIMALFNLIIYTGIWRQWHVPLFFIILNNLGYSFVFTSKYTYLGESYGENNFGQLVGYVSLSSGVVTIMMSLFSSVATHTTWSIVFVISNLVSFGLLAILSYRKMKKLTPLLAGIIYQEEKVSKEPMKSVA